MLDSLCTACQQLAVFAEDISRFAYIWGWSLSFMQGFEIEGQRLLIRFPDNPINNSGSITLRKSTPTTTPVSATIATSAKPSQAKG